MHGVALRYVMLLLLQALDSEQGTLLGVEYIMIISTLGGEGIHGIGIHGG